MTNTTRSDVALAALACALFAVSAGVTVRWCASMATMLEMPMAGGWSMSMTWMRMPGQSWAAATGSFLGMWMLMMVAMMLPAVTPILRLCRHSAPLVLLAASGYFCVYALLGLVVFPLGVALAALEMRYPALAAAVPAASGATIFAAGVLNCSPWKARHLASCRELPSCTCTGTVGGMSAWRYGIVMGLRCCRCCAGPMAILLVLGVMDLKAMILVTVAISLERLVPAGAVIAKVTGMLFAVAGLSMVGSAIGVGTAGM